MTLIDVSNFLNASGLTQAVLIGFFAYLCKALIEKWISNDTENYKADLAREKTIFEQDLKNIFELQIEAYKSSLEKERIRLQISYGGIFEKQAEAIIELHKLLIEVEATINDALYENDDNSSKTLFLEKRNALNKFLNENRIIIPETIDNKLYGFQRTAYISVMNYRTAQDYIQRQTTNPNIVDHMIERQQKAEADRNSLFELKEELIKETRRLMGILDEDISK
ncbi:hypothetical protein HQ393_10190 [Chitinibacter bivalviorum]|uniref:Uncharacterized protein n=1 Tax=Chitinibacter bivalviorum TaxID=2739434 RepID=A0A7H9BIV7_9NEIS|nr:hypothetical protein [Chitinibacter bivalviorum]QLG88580.1 hypothetical protein HQ393_10190 [Chitinibacter bivalviorum]